MLRSYPITARSVAYSLILLGLAVVSIVQMFERYSAEFRQRHSTLAKQSVQAVVSEIHVLRESIQRGSRLFVENYSDELLAFSRNPNSEELHSLIRGALAQHFPEHYSFTLTDNNGIPYYEDFGETIGELCLANISEVAQTSHPSQLVVHPGPGDYHVDFMVPWIHQGKPLGIFFKSYHLEFLRKLLAIAQADHQRLVLLRRSAPNLIEITAEGGRDIIQQHRSNHLTSEELERIGYAEDIPDSDWQLVAVFDKDLFARHEQAFMRPAIVSLLLLLLLGGFAIFFINREERRRNQAEQHLTEANNHLESRVEQRTNELRQANVQLQDEIERRDKAEQTQRILQRAAHQSTELFFITDRQSRIEYANPQFLRIYGYTAGEVIGQAAGILKSGLMEPGFYVELRATLERREAFSGVFINRTKDGEIRYIDQTLSPILDDNGQIDHFIVTGMDVTQKRQDVERMKYLSEHDLLTGLFNREYLKEYVTQHLAGGDSAPPLALLYIKVARFNHLFDGLGFYPGNLLVKEIANRLQCLQFPGANVARVGTDEFVISAPDLENADEAAPLAERVLSVFRKPIELQEQLLTINLNLGIALCPQDGTGFDDLIHHAYSALNRARANGDCSYEFYQAGLTEQAKENFQFELKVRDAVSNRIIDFSYQPKVSFVDGGLVGFECLSRWYDEPSSRSISPELFIPAAEDTGMISTLCEQCLVNAARVLKEDILPLQPDARIAINLSAHQFRGGRMIQSLKSMLESLQLTPAQFEFEVTEGTLINNLDETVATLRELHDMGFQISLDDFGTGYSSMQYLKEMPIDHLKIDKSFVLHMDTNDSDSKFVNAIVAMAHGLQISVIAEGVESPAHWGMLKRMGCDIAQGYLVAKPIPNTQLRDWITDYQSRPFGSVAMG